MDTGEKRKVITAATCEGAALVPLKEIVLAVVSLAQTMCEKKYYPYQVQLAYRIVESVLLRDGETLTALFSRQSGKTEIVSSLVAALLVILPYLAKQYPDDFRFNLTDEHGRDRGFGGGIRVGIYAPRMDQASIMYERVRLYLGTKNSKRVLKEMNLEVEVSNGTTVRISNGSRCLCESASEQSKIEGETHDLLIAEEAQDITDLKMKKSLHPMVSSRNGTIVKIGTSTSQRCDFYDSIKTNERYELAGGPKNHFFYPYQVCQKFNSLYKLYIEKEKVRIGEDSDEFLMAYECKWLFERGMFVTQEQLFHKSVAVTDGHMFGNMYPYGLPTHNGPYSLVVGIDWGRMYDSTVLTVMAVDWNNPVETVSIQNDQGINHIDLFNAHVINWVEWQGDNYEYQFHEIVAYLMSLGPNLKRIVTDSNTAGQPIFDRLASVFEDREIEVMPFNFQERKKSDAYKAFYAAICGRRITFPASKGTRLTPAYRKFVHQMLELRKSYKRGVMHVTHPLVKNAHDDYCDSVCMALWGTLTPSNLVETQSSSSNFFMQ